MIEVGYLAGARAYFKRAAEAGSGDAALLLGATFDPDFIDRIGAHGIKADPQQARGWYQRAEQLGVEAMMVAILRRMPVSSAVSRRWVQTASKSGTSRTLTANGHMAASTPLVIPNCCVSRITPSKARTPIH
jgi:TPR repeat protein